jgi:hypothetical protein
MCTWVKTPCRLLNQSSHPIVNINLKLISQNFMAIDAEFVFLLKPQIQWNNLR